MRDIRIPREEVLPLDRNARQTDFSFWTTDVKNWRKSHENTIFFFSFVSSIPSSGISMDRVQLAILSGKRIALVTIPVSRVRDKVSNIFVPWVRKIIGAFWGNKLPCTENSTYCFIFVRLLWKQKFNWTHPRLKVCFWWKCYNKNCFSKHGSADNLESNLSRLASRWET